MLIIPPMILIDGIQIDGNICEHTQCHRHTRKIYWMKLRAVVVQRKVNDKFPAAIAACAIVVVALGVFYILHYCPPKVEIVAKRAMPRGAAALLFCGGGVAIACVKIKQTKKD